MSKRAASDEVVSDGTQSEYSDATKKKKTEQVYESQGDGMSSKKKVCICGGGNGAHVMAGLAAAHESAPEVRVLTLYQDEAERWAAQLKKGDFIVTKKDQDKEIKGNPALVTKDPSKAVTGADVIIFCVPAFAHQQYFEAIAPHVAENTAIIGLPGQPGFEFQCFHILKDKAKTCDILNYETLPWACRIAEFGRKVDMLGAKEALTGSKVCGKGGTRGGVDPAALLQSYLGSQPVLKKAHNYLELIMMAMTFSHPPLMYGKWKDWDGKPLDDKPLFYQGVSQYAADLLCELSDEVETLAKVIAEKKPEADMSCLEHARDWLMGSYTKVIEDKSSFYTAMRTNKAYDGLVHPMKEVSSDKFVPDFHHRYLSEDIPFGLMVVKGIAQIMGVPMPKTDMVVAWAQGHMGKEFLVKGKDGVNYELKGKDVKDTRAPQAFGFQKIEDLLALI